MTRVARNNLLYEGCYLHVISRSMRKIKLFKDDEDFQKFKEFLLAAKKKGQFRLFHYCIMRTHFHLAVQMGKVKDFSYAIRDLKRSYVYWFHAKYKLSGPVWRERFRSLLIENEDYLYACGQYIENNPREAGLVNESKDWPYSSCKHYQLCASDELIDRYENNIHETKDLVIAREEFENGSIIGSSFFKFQFLENQKKLRRVPR